MKTNEIRRLYLEFFRSKGHEVSLSDSLVPADDPTLLFTGAGMNQFKEKFLGRNVTFKRAASCQKCLRTGDLENVGRTSGHHTFFEMLGNFSFGDYFKKDAIAWAWEFLTQNLKLKSQNLWISVYKDDEEAYDIWKNIINIPEARIVKFGAKENFWPSEAPAKGPCGPCGPCSEIYYNYGKDVGCKKAGCTPACDCGRFVEVWNLVFTQFDRQPDGSLKPLPSKNIDTGMGLERLASVMQGVKTNFEIDIFVPIVMEIKKSMDHSPWTMDKTRKANAIADHIRAVTFMITDGVMPSNEERGYVVRKLIRRSATHTIDLGIKGTFLYKLVSVIAEVMSEPYPEIKTRRDEIAQIVKKEEENFLFVEEMQRPKADELFKKADDEYEIAKAAFILRDTFGLSEESIEASAKTYNKKINKHLVEQFREKQREQSRSKTKIKGEIFTETFAKKVEALGLKTEFLGHDESRLKAKVVAVLDGGEVILDKTPFYGESGGQAGDWGKIETASGVMEIEDAKKIGDTIVHIGRMLNGKIVKGEAATAEIDEAVRKKVMANHTATHLLQAALRKILGDHARQTGSLVDAEHLRFDFTHMEKLEAREVARVEELVNENIKHAIPVKKEIKDIESAKREGATALFGEKYGDKVRVVTVGDVSKELCGGTHAANTKDIGIFRITSESSSASGVRRIEAVTGDAAIAWTEKQEEVESLKLKVQSEKEEEKKRLEARVKAEIGNIDSIIKRAISAGPAKIITGIIKDLNMEGLRKLSDIIKDKEKSSVIVLSTITSDKAAFIVSVTDDLVKKGLNAGSVAKDMAALIDGSGGGRPGFAQGGGKDPAKLEEALQKTLAVLQEKLRQ